jgi:CRISPR-associated protein Csm5
MNYRLTALSPLLVGDGQRLAPIDYMVWKDQVNVLDQSRIFRLLAKGPRLENYLTQIKKAEKLDFASWGGFAQNYAGRRIPFEHASSSAQWDKARAELLHIPTFCSGIHGHFLPGSALKGALRTGLAHQRIQAGVMKELAGRMQGDRPVRRPGEAAELMTLGNSAGDPMRLVLAGDSKPVEISNFRVYLLRTATLESRQANRFELGWKQAGGRGSVAGNRPDDGSLAFAEMAQPGTVFQGDFDEKVFLKTPEVARSLRLSESASLEKIFAAANTYSAELLKMQRRYMAAANLAKVDQALAAIEARLGDASSGKACLLNLGWGAGLLGKTAYLDTSNEDYRKMLRSIPYYERAIRTGMPFPKTRRIVFLQNQPATLAGWALLEVV